MAIPNFKTFFPDVARWVPTSWRQEYKLIVNDQGVPMGLQSQNANGADGIWAFTPLSQAEILAPTAAMLADLGAVYQLNESPYSLYHSDGVQLVSMDDAGGTIIPAGQIPIFASPFMVTEATSPFVIQGGIRVIE